MSMSPAVDVTSLRKTYRDGLFGRRRVEALAGVTLDVGRGEIFGLLGPNGAGKTTLIKVLLGMVRATGGAASLLGRSAGSRAARREVGYLPENHRIPRHHTGNSALAVLRQSERAVGAEVRRRSEPLLATVGLSAWGQTSIKKYSKGMLQRLGLALAMLHDPELLILDEPTDGVDPVGRSEMRTLLLGTQGARQNHLRQQPPAAGSRAGMRPGSDSGSRADVAAREDLRADVARRRRSATGRRRQRSPVARLRSLECRRRNAATGHRAVRDPAARRGPASRSTAPSTSCARRG